jgi:predicted MFS family arabinose efflux permease
VSSASVTARLDSRRPFPAQFVVPLFLGAAMNPINSSVLATALVPIGHALHVSVGRTTVLVSVLYVASSIAQPTAGRLAEHFGPRRVLLVGAAIVFVGGIVGGSGKSLTALIIARILLGIGTSGGLPSAMVQIRRRASLAGIATPPGWLFAGLSGTGELALVIGLPLGALLMSVAGWQAAFLLNLPLACLTFGLGLSFLPSDPPRDRMPVRALAAELDVLGMAAFAAATVSFLLFLLGLPSIEWPLLGVSLISGLCLLARELRAPTPFIDVRLLARNRPLTRTYARTAIMLFSTYVVLYGFTLWLQTAGGYTTGEAGLLVLPLAVVGAAAAIPVSRWRLSMTLLMIAPISALIGAVALFIVATSSSITWILVVTIAFGVTEASVYVVNQRLIATQAPAPRIGTAIGLFSTAVYSGAIVSSALTSVFFRDGVTASGLQHIAAVLVGCSLLAFVLTSRERGLSQISSSSKGAA